ncbi:aminotransferase class I/II-fold pyridoxal phosphate-dependent enzyme [Arthrobacter sp. ATA002]|uniref:aminotransferase class I/II-fold pyridoxal phosphate-dependent enzyme n=1 Tax=Arthrobacter sp. ATA002 TaxID=2991715 RepID=UPI003FA41BDB
MSAQRQPIIARTATRRRLCWTPRNPLSQGTGAFYLWADLSHASQGNVRAWAQRFLADQGVAVAPGTAFGSIGEGWIRIALCGGRDELVTGLGRLPAR